MIRKGTVFILTSKINEALGYIISQIPDNYKFTYRKEFNNYYHISINDYDIYIKHTMNENARGYRPELVYIIQGAEIKQEIFDDIIKPKTFMSVRKEPIRIIRFVEGIDVGEFLYDDHAELGYCDEDKLKRWNDMINPKENNTEKFKREYDCTWGENESE
jgi:hypothetical protein